MLFGEDQYIDLLFFNRELNCLVAVELKTGKFKTSKDMSDKLKKALPDIDDLKKLLGTDE